MGIDAKFGSPWVCAGEFWASGETRPGKFDGELTTARVDHGDDALGGGVSIATMIDESDL